MTPRKRAPMSIVQYNAPVILTFALISLGALALAHFTDDRSNQLFFMVYRAPLTDPLMYLRLFTHALGHADMSHFISNFFIIMLVGPMLEEKYGGKWLIIMMVVTAFVTGILHVAVLPFPHAKLGASGIVFMMMLLGSFTNLSKGRIPLTFIFALFFYIGREVMIYANAGATTNIAHMTHIVGGLCGAVFGFIINKDKWQKEHGLSFIE